MKKKWEIVELTDRGSAKSACIGFFGAHWSREKEKKQCTLIIPAALRNVFRNCT